MIIRCLSCRSVISATNPVLTSGETEKTVPFRCPHCGARYDVRILQTAPATCDQGKLDTIRNYNMPENEREAKMAKILRGGEDVSG